MREFARTSTFGCAPQTCPSDLSDSGRILWTGDLLSRQSAKISVELTSDLAGFVHKQTKSGKYTSASEVVQEALRLMEAAERIRARRLRDVKAKIAEGLISLNRGEGLDGEEVFRELGADMSGRRGGKKSRR